MKTKVIHLIHHLKMGGAETLITDYALKIDKQKFEIIIVTLSGSTNSINESKLAKEGIKVIFLGDKLPFSNAANVFKRIINRVYRYILFINTTSREKPHIIHTHLEVNSYVIPLKIRNKGIKLFYTLHSDINASFGKGKFKNKLITNYLVKRKRMIPIALHSNMKSETNYLFNTNNCIVVPNGIDLRKFTSINQDRALLLESLSIEKDAFIVGHVGRFVRSKNHEFLLNVFAVVKKKRPNAHLMLIGTGDLENRIREQVKELGLYDSVSFLGTREDIPELMNVMDVFVFPSLYEGFGNVLIEAQASGVKCVVSDSVPSDAFATNLVTTLSLDDSIEKWVKYIITPKSVMEIYGDLAKHDINNIVRNLEYLYLEHSNC